MHTKIARLFFLLIISQFAFAANDPVKVAASLKTVTVYRSGAEMLHNANAQLQQGANEIIIEGISNSIDINSIQINCATAVTLMGVEFSNNYLVTPERGKTIQLLKDSAEKITKEIEKIQVQAATINDLLEVLKANKDIKGSQTGLSVAELMWP